MTDMGSMDSNWRQSKRPISVRCPYCIEGREFKMMFNRDSEECFWCSNCGHLAMPKHPNFKCPCTKCIAINLRSRVRPC